MERENCTMAEHERAQDLSSILVLENPRLCSSGSLGSLLRRVDSIVPEGADGLGQHPGLEQRMRNGYFDSRRGGHNCGTGRGWKSTPCSGGYGSKDEMI